MRTRTGEGVRTRGPGGGSGVGTRTLATAWREAFSRRKERGARGPVRTQIGQAVGQVSQAADRLLSLLKLLQQPEVAGDDHVISGVRHRACAPRGSASSCARGGASVEKKRERTSQACGKTACEGRLSLWSTFFQRRAPPGPARSRRDAAGHRDGAREWAGGGASASSVRWHFKNVDYMHGVDARRSPRHAFGGSFGRPRLSNWREQSAAMRGVDGWVSDGEGRGGKERRAVGEARARTGVGGAERGASSEG